MKGYKYKKQKYQSKLPVDDIRLPTEKEIQMGMAEAFLLVEAIKINEKQIRREKELSK